MDAIYLKHQELLKKLTPFFTRPLEDEIEWKEQLIGIKGARGVGKTTFLLQHIKAKFGFDKSALFVSLDDIRFTQKNLVELAEEFLNKGGKYLFLDEIHKYPNWSQELKNIYDSYPELKVVFTGSSILHIHGGNADLSRRAVVYYMKGLSFREYLQIETKQNFEVLSLKELLANHEEIVRSIASKIKPLVYFDDYLRYGYYPYYLQSKKTYHNKLANTINLILEIDLPYLMNVDLKYVYKLKQLLYILATSVPFQPNISNLAGSLEISRQSVLAYLDYLQNAELIYLLKDKGKSYSILAKPNKIYLNNPNLSFALAAENTDKGNLRETFFYNQLKQAHSVESSEKGDFLIDGKFTFEVGGKSKKFKQIKNIKNSYLAIDDIEAGINNKIPLWLFGFLY